MRGATEQENRAGGRLLDKAVWLLFCATCLQLGFLQPNVVLVHGERTNLFSGLVCAIALCGALLVAKKRKPTWTMPELLISMGLLCKAANRS